MSPQVKSRQRVVDHGEVFTNEREVSAMLDMVKQETKRIESRFLEPAVTQEMLDELEPGDTVFHKAFGYGRIIDIDGSYIEVTFDSDDKKKKPSRKFMFPSAFFQGLLQIG